MDPLTLSLILSGVSQGTNYFAGRQEEKEMRRVQREQESRDRTANLINTIGQNNIYQAPRVAYQQPRGAAFLRNIGAATNIGAQAAQLYGGIQDARAAKASADALSAEELKKIRFENDTALGQLYGSAAPINAPGSAVAGKPQPAPKVPVPSLTTGSLEQANQPPFRVSEIGGDSAYQQMLRERYANAGAELPSDPLFGGSNGSAPADPLRAAGKASVSLQAMPTKPAGAQLRFGPTQALPKDASPAFMAARDAMINQRKAAEANMRSQDIINQLRIAEAMRKQAIGEGMDAALSGRSSTALGQGANLAGTALSMGGGTSEAPISSSLYETVVKAPTVTDTRPGFAYGMYQGKQMMEADKYKYGALERQYQQYENIAKQVTDNPRLFRELDADVKKYIMPMLSDETTKIIGLRDLTSGDMDKLASARDALQELYKLREMTVDLQQRGLLGPTGTVSAGFNDQERRLLGEFDTQRTGAMRKLALALNKGALSENDVEAVNEAMPDRTAVFDATTFGRFDALLGNQISLADSRLKLFSEQNYNIKGLELPDYLQSFVPLTDVYREAKRRGLNR